MELKGNIGSSPVGYDVVVDASLNLTLSIVYKDPGSGSSVGISAGAPLGAILTKIASGLKAGSIGAEAEGLLVGAIEAYVASQPAST